MKVAGLLREMEVKHIRNHPVKTITGQWRFIDIYIPNHHLAIEIDGKDHKKAKKKKDDLWREEQLKATIPCRFLRFTNSEVKHKIKEVRRRIADELGFMTPEQQKAIDIMKLDAWGWDQHLRNIWYGRA